MAVPFEELSDSPQESFADGRFSATRRLKVNWADRLDLVVELYGGYRLVGGQFVFTPPAPYPSVPQALVTDVRIEPFPPGKPDGSGVTTLGSATNAYPFAIVTATYRIQFDTDNASRSDLPGVPDGTFLTFDSDVGVESQHTPGRTWKWDSVSEKVPPDIQPGIFIPSEEFTLAWHRVPSPPWDKIRDLRGKVNTTTFLNHPAGTVLFTGGRTERQFQVTGSGFWRLAYRFKVKEVESTASAGTLFGWNRFYREKASASEHWLEIKDEDGNLPYRSGDLNLLFQFG